MAKIREVFDGDAIVHVWVYGKYKGKDGDVTVTSGHTKPCTAGKAWRSSGYIRGQYLAKGNQHFEGDHFYSYSTKVAKRYDLGDNGWLFLVSSHDYGLTTRGQVSNLLRAIPETLHGRPTHTIFFDTAERFPNGLGEKYAAEWVSVVDFLLAQASEVRGKALKARENRASIIARGLADVAQAEKLNSLLILECGGDIDRVKLDFERVPEYVAKPPNPNQRKYIRDWIDALEYLPNLPMIAAKVFRDNADSLEFAGVSVADRVITIVLDPFVGSKLTLRLKLSDCPWANIKVVGDRVLTSMGVRLGKEEVTRLYEAMLEVCREQKNGLGVGSYWVTFNKWGMWQRNKGLRLRNVISVGCHYFDPSTLASGYKYILDSLPAISS